jgi:hypothetical protein
LPQILLKDAYLSTNYGANVQINQLIARAIIPRDFHHTDYCLSLNCRRVRDYEPLYGQNGGGIHNLYVHARDPYRFQRDDVLGPQGSKMTGNTTARQNRVETAYKLTRGLFVLPKGGVDQCELALTANLMVACGFHGAPRSHWLLSLLHRSAATETLRP